MPHAVPGGIHDNGEKSWIVFESWGIDHDYYLARKWSVGCHSDVVLENFEFGEEGSEEGPTNIRLDSAWGDYG